jgi:hypothetical protein
MLKADIVSQVFKHTDLFNWFVIYRSFCCYWLPWNARIFVFAADIVLFYSPAILNNSNMPFCKSTSDLVFALSSINRKGVIKAEFL